MSNLYDAYWTGFMAALEGRAGFHLKAKKIPHANCIVWSCFGRKGFKLIASVSQSERRLDLR